MIVLRSQTGVLVAAIALPRVAAKVAFELGDPLVLLAQIATAPFVSLRLAGGGQIDPFRRNPHGCRDRRHGGSHDASAERNCGEQADESAGARRDHGGQDAQRLLTVW
jgi:hypothetical protein